MLRTISAVAAPAALLSCTGRMYGPGSGPGAMMNYGFYGFGGWFMWLLLIAAAAVVIYLLARSSKGGVPMGGQETALDILKRRYAKGEIDKDEFERMKRDIES